MQNTLNEAARHESFVSINAGYNTVFKPGQLSVGLVLPVETYSNNPVPEMHRHIERVQLAESLGFSAVWLRDIPFNVPSFGDAGQVFDPFVYLGALASQTTSIALGVASIILPLRHPAHVAKAAATVDVLSGGRFIMGVASGDRPEEYPALALPFGERGKLFRDSFNYIRHMGDPQPQFRNGYGCVGGGMDMLPKPTTAKLPLLVTGSCQQSADWIAVNGDGWMVYPKSAALQSALIDQYRARLVAADEANKPVIEPLYVDLAVDPDTPAKPIHLGIHSGINSLREYLDTRRTIGVNHVALNLRFNRGNPESTLATLAELIIPEFSH